MNKPDFVYYASGMILTENFTAEELSAEYFSAQAFAITENELSTNEELMTEIFDLANFLEMIYDLGANSQAVKE